MSGLPYVTLSVVWSSPVGPKGELGEGLALPIKSFVLASTWLFLCLIKARQGMDVPDQCTGGKLDSFDSGQDQVSGALPSPGCLSSRVWQASHFISGPVFEINQL